MLETEHTACALPPWPPPRRLPAAAQSCVVTFAPVSRLPGGGPRFAALGLAAMLNGGGAVQAVDPTPDAAVAITLRGGGAFLAYSSRPPRSARVAGADVPFTHSPADGRLEVELPAARPRGGNGEGRASAEQCLDLQF